MNSAYCNIPYMSISCPLARGSRVRGSREGDRALIGATREENRSALISVAALRIPEVPSAAPQDKPSPLLGMTGKKPPDYSQKDSEKAAVTKLDGSRLCPRAGRPRH